MRIATLVSNVVLFVFTCVVLLTEGISREAPYVILSVLLLLVPILSSVVLSRTGIKGEERGGSGERSSASAVTDRFAVYCNLLLIAFSTWAIATQYPHPKEEGAIAAVSLGVFTVLVVVTPVMTVLVLLGSVRRRKRGQRKSIVQER